MSGEVDEWLQMLISSVNILAKSTPYPQPPSPRVGGRNKLLPCYFKNREEISFDPKKF